MSTLFIHDTASLISFGITPLIMTSTRATGLGLIAVLMWSLSVGLTRSLAEALGPYCAGAAIYSVSGLFVWLLMGKPQLKQQHPVYLIGCGLLFILYMVCFALAIGLAHNSQQSLEVGLVNYLWPSLTLVLAVFMQKLNVKWWLWPGMICAFAGIIWAISGGQLSIIAIQSNIADNPLVYGLSMLAAVAWALYSNLVRKYAQGQNALALFLFCTALVLWVITAIFNDQLIALTASTILQLLVMGASTAIGYICWDKAVKSGNVTLVAVFSYFTPLTSLVIASMWLGTPLNKTFLPGIGLVIVGSLLCWHASRQSAP